MLRLGLRNFVRIQKTHVKLAQHNTICNFSSLKKDEKTNLFFSYFHLQNQNYSSEVKKTDTSHLLSKLFPQTAPENENTEDKKHEQNSKRMKYVVALISGGLFAASVWILFEFGKPELDENGNIIEDAFSKEPIVPQYFMRMWKSFTYYQKMIQEPSRDKLLPDPLKPPYIQPPYTLVLEMKDVLVHPDWTYNTGWRFKKRPGVDFFLEQCAKNFEIVVFTADQGMTVFPILDALDPKGYIMYRLVRDATHFVDGHHIKNLDNLNRDLKKVIVIDWDPNTTRFHPTNSLNISRWEGNDNDIALYDLVAFLKTLATAEVDDVREVLEYYNQFENPLSKFRENQRKLQEQLYIKEKEQQKQKPAVTQWTKNFTRR